MTAASPLTLILQVSATVLYPNAEGRIIGRQLPGPTAGVVKCELYFKDGARAESSLLSVEENGWLLLVLAYTTARGHSVPSRSWALEQCPNDPEGFRIRSMIPAGPVEVI